MLCACRKWGNGSDFWEQQEAQGSIPSLRFHPRVGLADLELQTRALEKVFYQGEVRLVGSPARPEVAKRAWSLSRPSFSVRSGLLLGCD